jgi:hypothetical protein
MDPTAWAALLDSKSVSVGTIAKWNSKQIVF